MAEQEQVLIEVKFDTSTLEKAKSALATNLKQLQDNKKELAALNKTIKDGAELNASQAARYAELNKLIDANKREVKSNTAIIQAATTSKEEMNDTLDKQRQFVGMVQKAFAGLTKEQKEAMGGEEAIAAYIKNLNDNLVELEQSIGENGRNVGNYGESMKKAFGEMAHASEMMSPAISLLRGMGGAGAEAAKKLDTLQKVLQLGGKAAQFFQRTSQAQTAAQTAATSATTAQTAATSAEAAATETATIAQKGLNTVMAANPIGAIITAISTLLPLVMGLADAFEPLASLFGSTTEEADDYSDSMDRMADSVDYATDKINKQVEALSQMQSANKHILRLMGIQGASEAELHSNTMRMLEEELAKAEEIEKRAQKEIFRYAQKYADKIITDGSGTKGVYSTDESQEGANKLEEELAKAKDRITAIHREMEIEDAEFNKKTTENAKKAADEKHKADVEEYELKRQERAAWESFVNAEDEASVERLKERLQAESDALKEWLASLDEGEEEEDIPTPEEMARDQFGLDEEGVEYYLSLLEKGVSLGDAKIQAIGDQTKRLTKSFASSFAVLGQSFSSMADMLGEFTNESAEAAQAQKAFSLMSILLSQAESIAEGALAVATGIEKATQIGFPQNIPAIIATVATIGSLMGGVASTIMQAKQVFASAADAGSFAEGGIVGGTSYSGDRLTAHVNSREMILPMEAQKTLFDALSSSNNGDNLQLGIDYGMMAQAVSAIPAPVLVLKELNDAQDRVTTITEIASV